MQSFIKNPLLKYLPKFPASRTTAPVMLMLVMCSVLLAPLTACKELFTPTPVRHC